jgi:hypothetical protein
MATKDLMIDIETLSTAVDALVLSIGVTPFACTPTGVEVGECSTIIPNLVEQILLGRRIDRSTQLWWAKQPDSVQDHWRKPVGGKMDVRPALAVLNDLITETKPARVWARGPHFDIAILQSLFQLMDMEPAWGYNAIRDVRTFCDDREAIRTYDGPSVLMPKHHPARDNFDQIIDLWQHGLGGTVEMLPVISDVKLAC